MESNTQSEDEDSFSEHSSFLESNRRENEEEEVEAGFANDDVFVELLLEDIERPKRKPKRSSSSDYDPSSKHRCLKSIKRKEEEQEDDAASITSDPLYQERKKKSSDSFWRRVEQEDNAVLIEPRLKSCSVQSKRQRFSDDEDPSAEHRFLESIRREEQEGEQEQEEYAYDGVSSRPGLDSVRSNRQCFGDDKDPSSSSLSIEEIDALCLIQLSGDDHYKQRSQRPMQTKPQTPRQILPKFDLFKCSLCGKEFSSNRALGSHKACHSVKPPQPQTQPQILLKFDPFKCSVCGKEFTSNRALGGHKAHCHRVKPPQPQTQPQILPKFDLFKCSVCGKEFTSNRALGGHKARSHSVKPPQPQTQPQILPKFDPYKFSVCGKEFTSNRALGGHKAHCHSVKLPRPPVKNASADAEGGDKTRPKTLLPSGKIHRCYICRIVLRTGQALDRHNRIHHQRLRPEGDKLSPSDNGSVVTNVSDPVHSLEGLIDLNKVPSPESDESGRRDLKEDESAVLANKPQQGRGFSNTNA